MTGNLQILIVENDAFEQTMLKIELAKEGFQTVSCQTAHEAMLILYNKNIEIDCCLIDYRLPDANGINLMSQIKSIRSELPIIIMANNNNKNIFQAALHGGAFDYIEKPFFIKNKILPIIKRAITTIILKKENRYLTNQILHSSKLAALGELSATVVHDICGPLTMIQITCEDMSDELAEKKPIDCLTFEKQLRQINKSCQRIKKLVDHLRNYSRKDKDECQEGKNLGMIVEDSLFLVEQKIRKFGIKTTTEIEDDLMNAELVCLPNKLEQALMNLLSNACDAMQSAEKKELILKARVENDFLYLSIIDSGCGISDTLKSKIFEGFFTTKPKNEGTGLGLNIVRNIIKEHDGELLVESEIGKGSVFTIKLSTSRLLMQNVSRTSFSSVA